MGANQKEMFFSKGNTLQIKNVLTRTDLRPLRLAYPNDTFESFIKKHDLHRITIHGIRHTHASLLFEAGSSLKEVQDRLGHQDIKTTMDVYTHVTRAVKEKTADTFQKFMDM
ncbi:hypothetical protein D7Z54_32800 [Salibacterium salarium]|uniref:Tyr recombinase domain-containing protein n=1 Tax=Salibacterium salarium TaxID=284579 RepID=A0A428MSJ5_9BACI|nr:tyrosine-type recombinase/integrase [Salibacterium salarium]RSL29140.1 hypothetical protein D7Z54_32800 [Salibacterium salarium]